MKSKLYREANGNFGLSHMEPLRARMEGTEIETYYVPVRDGVGDSVGFRHMCVPSTIGLCNGNPGLNPMDDSIDVEAYILPSPVPQWLRKAIEEHQKWTKGGEQND